ncbi:MAG: hypothetical protein HFI75_04940 [Lachnospiraceae bacterium]|nr:hypothetical protein [Lachnospiraceae bacterium]
MKVKGIMTHVLLLSVIAASFAVPQWIMQNRQKKMFKQTYHVDRQIPMVKAEAGKSELVSAVYSRYANNQRYAVSCGDIYESTENLFVVENGKVQYNRQLDLQFDDGRQFLDGMDELIQIGLIKDSFFQLLAKEDALICRTWVYDNEEIIYEKSKLFSSGDSFSYAVGSIEVERKTNKIISLTLGNEYVQMNPKTMEQYIQYLGLAIFGDWKYNEYEDEDALSGQKYMRQECCSESGRIKIEVKQEDGKYQIRVLPLEGADFIL